MEGKRFCRMDSMVVDCGHHLAREGDPGSRTLDYKRESAPRPADIFGRAKSRTTFLVPAYNGGWVAADMRKWPKMATLESVAMFGRNTDREA